MAKASINGIKSIGESKRNGGNNRNGRNAKRNRRNGAGNIEN